MTATSRPQFELPVPRQTIAAVPVVAAVAGAAVALSGGSPIIALGAVAVILTAIIAVSPFVGACTWLLVGPLVVGIARGDAIPFARPNELLLLVAAAGVALHGWWQISQGRRFFPRLGLVDLVVGLLAVTGSILPVVVLYIRGAEATEDDVFYALVFAKYFVLYALFRVAVTSKEQVALCLWLIVASSALVAVIAILQVASLFGVAEFLSAFYDSPFEGTVGTAAFRGSSTIASSFGLADMMAMSLAIVVAWLPLRPRGWPLLLVAGVAFLAAGVAAGSFSGLIGCVIAVIVAAYLSGQLMTLLAVALPGGLIVSAAFWPVIAARIAGFDNLNGLPRSWVGRLANLETFFWPQLFSGTNWIWGVRPAARVPAPETWRTWVFIESGHTWLLWTGGIPLLVAFFAFTAVVLRKMLEVLRGGRDAVGVAASAAFTATIVIFVLMLFDPHLTVRGSADLFFPLLALAMIDRRKTSPPAESGAAKAQKGAGIT
jgi:hypothetical protein